MAQSLDHLRQISTETLSDRVYSVVRDLLLRNEFAPGVFIREREIAERLGVSPTPVREAMGRLAMESFLERIPHRGYRVPEQSTESLLDLYPIVCGLELMAARSSFPQLTAGDVAALRALNERFGAAMEREDFQIAIELNNEFHHALSERCGNQRLCDLLDDLRAEARRLESWSISHITHRKESFAQHEEILDAIEGGEYEEAFRVLKLNRLQTWEAFHEEMGVPVPSEEDSETVAEVDAIPTAKGG